MTARFLFVASLVACLFGPATSLAVVEEINKDFKNSTGNRRNDLHWTFVGHVASRIVGTYSPPQLPNAPVIEENVPPMPGAQEFTTVKWSGGDVADGTTIHCGVMVDWGDAVPPKRFAEIAYWSLDGVRQERVAGCGSVNFDFGSEIDMSVDNTSSLTDPAIDVSDFSYAYVGMPFQLAQLTWNNPEIPWIPIDGSATIPPAGGMPIATLPGTEPGNFVVVQLSVNITGEPAANAGHIIVQRQVPGPTGTETSTWGSIKALYR